MSVTWYPITVRKLRLRLCRTYPGISIRIDTLFTQFIYIDRAWKFYVITPIYLYRPLWAFLSRTIQTCSYSARLIFQCYLESARVTCNSKHLNLFRAPALADNATATALLASWNQISCDCDINFKGGLL